MGPNVHLHFISTLIAKLGGTKSVSFVCSSAFCITSLTYTLKKVTDMRFVINVSYQLSYNRQFLTNVLQLNFSLIYTQSYCELMNPPLKKEVHLTAISVGPRTKFLTNLSGLGDRICRQIMSQLCFI